MDQGEEFRERVYLLLRAAGMVAEKEVYVSGKNIDILASTAIFGRSFRIAIECKFSASNVGLSEISRECAEYKKIVDDPASDINVAWIVASGLFTAPARAYAGSIKGIDLLGYADLTSRLFDITPYVISLQREYEEGQAGAIYVPLRADSGRPLADVVEEWMSSPHDPAMAVIAGYGRGKTTFATRLAGQLAGRALADPTERMPILLRLSELAHEVQLSGLILNTVAGRTIAQRLSFEFFKSLNAGGRFIIIADGFDEMKYGLNFEEFDYIFSQVKDLIDGQAKVLLLGRPSAFLSDREELAVMSSTQDASLMAMRDRGDRMFRRISIDLFTDEEARHYVRESAKRAEGSMPQSARAEPIEVVADRWIENTTGDILRRPVHAWMLASIVISSREAPTGLTLYKLYDRFVERLVQRELEKPGRDRRISMPRRRAFARELAWWSWSVLKRTSFPVAEIPLDIVRSTLRGTGVPLNTGRRELIVSAPLDKKAIGEPKLAFPHRSIQEFLVAEYVIRAAASAKDDQFVRFSSRHITAEVADFIVTSGRKDELQRLLEAFLDRVYRRFHINLVRLLAKAVAPMELKLGLLSRPAADNPFALMVDLFSMGESGRFGGWSLEQVQPFCDSLSNDTPERTSFCVAMLLANVTNTGDEGLFIELLAAIGRLLPADVFIELAAALRTSDGGPPQLRPEIGALVVCIDYEDDLGDMVEVNARSMLGAIALRLGVAIEGIPSGDDVILQFDVAQFCGLMGWGDAEEVFEAVGYFAETRLETV